ncbi:hypothetical protein HPP92_014958 [Vanilla planifolia]|uniref:Uncharacterized protein n=1 Tax=Vanilla planifolia TaxID=51239 RepID=A0A835QLE2_VANPL|nr:hypothetical protein HPP92_014958 [Vanilla planifolia]
MCITGKHQNYLAALTSILNLLPVFSRIQNLTEQKINHTGTMELIECLAGDPTYWEFIGRGKTGELGQRPSFLDEVPDVDDQPRFDSDKLPTEIPDTEDNDDKHQYRNQTNGYTQHDRNTTKSGNKAADVGLQRWNDSPLITGAKLGLYEFVEKILEVYPQSVNLLDAEGKNILQVAIQLGQEKILDTLAWRIAGRIPCSHHAFFTPETKKTTPFFTMLPRRRSRRTKPQLCRCSMRCSGSRRCKSWCPKICSTAGTHRR